MLKRTREYFRPDFKPALVDESLGIEVYIYPSQKPGCTTVKAFAGKRAKPDMYFYYSSSEKAQKAADDFVTRQREKAATKAAIRSSISVNVGDIFKSSWGYDQTNVDYYQVTKLIGSKMIEVREIHGIAHDIGDMTRRTVPDINNFINENHSRHLIQTISGQPFIKIKSNYHAILLTPKIIAGCKIYDSSFTSCYA